MRGVWGEEKGKGGEKLGVFSSGRLGLRPQTGPDPSDLISITRSAVPPFQNLLQFSRAAHDPDHNQGADIELQRSTPSCIAALKVTPISPRKGAREGFTKARAKTKSCHSAKG